MKWYHKLWSRVRALKFVRNTYGALTAKGAAALAIAFVVAAIVIPIGMTEIYATNTTGWNTAVITIFTVLFPILFVIAVALKVFEK